MGKKDWDSVDYRERALVAQKTAAEAPTDALRAMWQELAERYFELAEEVAPEALLRFHSTGKSKPHGGRILL